MMKDKCLNVNNIPKLKNAEKSLEYGVPIYELKGEDFNALVSCQMPPKGEYAHRIRRCYSLISQNNLDVYKDNIIIYGFTNFPTENIIHVLERDALSVDSLNNEYDEYVNRIRTNEEILGTKIMNEIQIANIYDPEIQKYRRIEPDYIVCFDEVNSLSLSEAQKKQLPIVIIDRKLYQELDKTVYKNIDNFGIYSFDSLSDYYPKKMPLK